jgi:hypothetical protein
MGIKCMKETVLEIRKSEEANIKEIFLNSKLQ